MLKKMLKSRRLTMLERDKRSWKESQDLLLRRLKMRNWNCKGNSRSKRRRDSGNRPRPKQLWRRLTRRSESAWKPRPHLPRL